jgi:hypothetical protein
MLGITPPGAQAFFVLKLDDSDPLAVVCKKPLVRNVARHGAGELGHAIDQGDVLVPQTRLQARAKHDYEHLNIPCAGVL